MIKLKNTEIFNLLSADLESLSLPVSDAFKIAVLLSDLVPMIKIYNEQVPKLKTDEEIGQLNDTETEFNFEPLEITNAWPKLTIKEAKTLLPLIKRKQVIP
jgi:hypothetical protein